MQPVDADVSYAQPEPEKRGRGRSKTSTVDQKLKKKMARNGKRKTVEVDAATYQSLEALRIATNTKSLGAILAQLIPLHPNCESETADPDADDLSDYDYDQRQVEVAETAGVVIDLVKLLLSVSDNETLSTSTYDRLFKKAFSYDVALLKSFFEEASSVRLKPDCSTRQGQERLSVFLTGWLNGEPVEKLYNFSWQGQ